jgi:hypothetical protein
VWPRGHIAANLLRFGTFVVDAPAIKWLTKIAESSPDLVGGRGELFTFK